MRPADLARFILNNYDENEQLVWQTVSQSDLGADNEEWAGFITHINKNSSLADSISRLIQDTYYDWIMDEYDR